ncbi:MAG TPA: group III truncated hemoglobin [Longimicrobium sp.]|uniref:group III truncated hemoglobin n=1 Tax=Longimicrobium sp. TaxID=2029185 RepID=UPI002ED78647
MTDTSAPPRPDLRGRADVARLVDQFYATATADPVIGWIFTDVARLDLPAHLPVMYDFWESILFGARSYRGGAMQVHLALNQKTPLTAEHFARWIGIFNATVDAQFCGPAAERAKEKAGYIAASMQMRLAAARGEAQAAHG